MDARAWIRLDRVRARAPARPRSPDHQAWGGYLRLVGEILVYWVGAAVEGKSRNAGCRRDRGPEPAVGGRGSSDPSKLRRCSPSRQSRLSSESRARAESTLQACSCREPRRASSFPLLSASRSFRSFRTRLTVHRLSTRSSNVAAPNRDQHQRLVDQPKVFDSDQLHSTSSEFSALLEQRKRLVRRCS